MPHSLEGGGPTVCDNGAYYRSHRLGLLKASPALAERLGAAEAAPPPLPPHPARACE